jgi:hypothetical protein
MASSFVHFPSAASLTSHTSFNLYLRRERHRLNSTLVRFIISHLLKELPCTLTVIATVSLHHIIFIGKYGRIIGPLLQLYLYTIKTAILYRNSTVSELSQQAFNITQAPFKTRRQTPTLSVIPALIATHNLGPDQDRLYLTSSQCHGNNFSQPRYPTVASSNWMCIPSFPSPISPIHHTNGVVKAP